jgi:uncharacterized protein
VWPASLGHSVHNAAWGTLAAFTATSSSVIVNQYLAGDNGILILVGTVIAAIWVRRRLGKGLQFHNQATRAAKPRLSRSQEGV